MVAHEYVARVHRRLVELDANDAHSRELLRRSAVLILQQMPALVGELRELEREWDLQQLLDPDAAQRTIASFTSRLAEIEPVLAQLRAQQDEIAAEMRTRLQAARGA